MCNGRGLTLGILVPLAMMACSGTEAEPSGLDGGMSESGTSANGSGGSATGSGGAMMTGSSGGRAATGGTIGAGGTGMAGVSGGAGVVGTAGVTGTGGINGNNATGGGVPGTGGVATGAGGMSRSGGTMGSAGAMGMGGSGVPGGRRPNPIISRNKTTFSSPAGGAAVVDGVYHNGGWSIVGPTTQAPGWVAIRIGAGPTRVLVSWDDGATYNYRTVTTELVYGMPAAYHIDVSANSTNGSDGTWTTAVTVANNTVRTRAHSVEFSGQSWVKMVITGTSANLSGYRVQIGEIDVHDLSAVAVGIPDDTWFFMGDSITAFSYDRAAAHQPAFATLINGASPAFFPAMINGGVGSETTINALARVDDALTLNSDYRIFALSYGTNDSTGTVSAAAFRTNLQMIIDRVKAAGRTPILARIPFANDGGHAAIPAYNTVIDDLTRTNQLRPGPDLYTWFQTHTNQFMPDNLHPNDAGQLAINQLWATAMRSLYP
jgi:acyl-CoA thioesterase-1